MSASPVAILCSDLHLSLQQPSARADKDWMLTQANYLQQLDGVSSQYNRNGELPVFIAGDIFDRWNPPPELIYFAMKHLPRIVYAVPGQHDLPNHRMDGKRRSGYGVLVQAGRIEDLSEGGSVVIGDCHYHGFGWNEPIAPPTGKDRINVAVIHRYVWVGGHKYTGAPEDAEVGAFKHHLAKYDLAVFGDNHKGFVASAGKCTVLNCGGFIRRKTDEIDYTPCYGVLFEDGSIKRVPFHTGNDKFHDIKEEHKEEEIDLSTFIEQLEGLGEHGLNFREAVERHVSSENLPPSVKRLVMEALDAK